MSGSLLTYLNLPVPQHPVSCAIAHEMHRGRSYNIAQLEDHVAKWEPMLTTDQLRVYEIVLRCKHGNTGCVLFVGAPGGTGRISLEPNPGKSEVDSVICTCLRLIWHSSNAS